MKSRNFDDFIERDLEREIARHERSLAKKQQQPQKPPAPRPSAYSLSQVPGKPLTWLWPGRIPQGHLTLLDGAPGSGLSLVALTLAACVSSGSPLPDGTPTQQGHVLLLAPYDSPTDTLKPRFEAAGGDPAHLMLVDPLLEDTSLALARTRSYAFPQDLDHLATLIRNLNARLVIIDPASAIPGLSRCLPSSSSPARPTVPSCWPAPCANHLPILCTHPVPLLPCSRPLALACCLLPTPPTMAASSCSPPNIPSARSRAC